MQNTDNLIKLIETVKSRPSLFENTALNEQEDFREWAAVAEECETTISEAQEQWQVLLLEYVEYLRSNQDFKLAHHMDFLQPYFFTINDDDAIDEEELLNAIDTKKHDENKDNLKQTSQEILKSTANKPEIKIKLERSYKIDGNSAESKPSSQPIVFDSISQNNSFTNLTSLELIFLGYAKQLQKMPLSLQLKTKRKIADIMDEAELQMMS